MSDIRVKSFEIKALDKEETPEDNSGVFKFKGYLSTYGNTDRDGDIVEKGAFDHSILERKTVPLLFNHDRNQVIGLAELTTDEKGVPATGSITLNTDLGKQVAELVKLGALNSMSVGMAIKDFDPIDNARPFGGARIKQADIYEASVVTIPANAEALIDQVKSLSEDERKELSELRKEKKFEAYKQTVLNKIINFKTKEDLS